MSTRQGRCRAAQGRHGLEPLYQRGHAAHSGGFRGPLPFRQHCSSRCNQRQILVGVGGGSSVARGRCHCLGAVSTVAVGSGPTSGLGGGGDSCSGGKGALGKGAVFTAPTRSGTAPLLGRGPPRSLVSSLRGPRYPHTWTSAMKTPDWSPPGGAPRRWCFRGRPPMRGPGGAPHGRCQPARGAWAEGGGGGGDRAGEVAGSGRGRRCLGGHCWLHGGAWDGAGGDGVREPAVSQPPPYAARIPVPSFARPPPGALHSCLSCTHLAMAAPASPLRWAAVVPMASPPAGRGCRSGLVGGSTWADAGVAAGGQKQERRRGAWLGSAEGPVCGRACRGER